VSIEHYCPRTKFTNISQEHRLPFIPLHASRRLLSTSAPIVSMCFIRDKFTDELQEQEENTQFTWTNEQQIISIVQLCKEGMTTNISSTFSNDLI
jgi:hypothetical protein